jgi:hypothetical protein
MKPTRSNDNNFRGTKNKYAIYPDWWPARYGAAPCLGYVRADSVFDAIRAAYDAKLLVVNRTFEPKPVLCRS